jgi:hypothetical protein
VMTLTADGMLEGEHVDSPTEYGAKRHFTPSP